jgi:DNA-binding NarL/FixJ family response regulator
VLRILIADDHDMIRKGIRKLVEAHPNWAVVGEASDGDRALEIALADRPDVAVLDIALPGPDGISITERLRPQAPEVKVLLFSIHGDEDTVSRGIAAGARGYILKSDEAGQLASAISALGANRRYFSPRVSDLIVQFQEHGDRKSIEAFTPRELEVARMVAQGSSNKEIAEHLGLSIKTVESHRRGAYEKAGVHTGPEFVRFAIREGLIEV